ncbi:MAG: energy transducer TonB [Chitinispirillaceae bacterium]|nr:energy transducer TonB [Chitinispirillaceae bacterium]
MTNRTTPAFLASCVLHALALLTVVTFLRAPRIMEHNELPLVPIMTLVRPPESPAVKAAAPEAKPRISRPVPPPEPVNLAPALEPVIETVPDAPAPEPVAEAVSAGAAPSVAPAPALPPADPVYPASKVRGGLVPLQGNEAPPYPLIAQDRGIEGSVDALFVVDKSGAVQDIWISRSSHRFFSESVMKNVRKWRFKPPVVDGKPARVKASQHFEFKLE